MNQREFKTFAEPTRITINRKGSRFIGVGVSPETKGGLDRRREELAEEFSKATHIASASVIIESGRPVERYDNDGEPSGTAGEPMLDVIKGEGLMNCAIFAVRYFGGTELGTGGLVRAYSDTARGVIETANLVSRQERGSTEGLFLIRLPDEWRRPSPNLTGWRSPREPTGKGRSCRFPYRWTTRNRCGAG